VRPSVPVRERFYSRYTPVPIAGCWLWEGALLDGYGYIEAEGKSERAHRVSWKLHNGEIPPEMAVLHECDVRCCVNPQHLFLGSNQDNVTDKVKKKRCAKGEKHSRARVTEAQVRAIRVDGRPISEIAKSYGLGYQGVWAILHRTSWRHID
jgi:hypothetical protein